MDDATHVGCPWPIHGGASSGLLKPGRKGGGPPEQALRFFERLYLIERLARDWLDGIAPKVVPGTKLGDAVSYTLNQWDYLTYYISDGRMPIDNNISGT
ncbi:IS66 family transposase [Neorhizobium galegae]|uniref:IS66 family transposase n=1 Tax=Neorhizobium galegae TaxID=399 RepID=UPI002105E528|nr:transposase [Neorhizobium galegae]MCQ1838727.1 transposase [Neorhizobium galegae]